jgi:hypothetical protein
MKQNPLQQWEEERVLLSEQVSLAVDLLVQLKIAVKGNKNDDT